jgi:hypothetical protein
LGVCALIENTEKSNTMTIALISFFLGLNKYNFSYNLPNQINKKL